MENMTLKEAQIDAQDTSDYHYARFIKSKEENKSKSYIDINQYYFFKTTAHGSVALIKLFVVRESENDFFIDCSKTHVYGNIGIFMPKSGFTTFGKSDLELISCWEFNEAVRDMKHLGY